MVALCLFSLENSGAADGSIDNISNLSALQERTRRLECRTAEPGNNQPEPLMARTSIYFVEKERFQ